MARRERGTAPIPASRLAPFALVGWMVVGAPEVSAQSVPPAQRATESGVPAWMTAWSPLNPIADVPRTLPRAAPVTDLLGSPAPTVGLFWFAGTPAALGFEVGERRGQLAGTLAGDDGAYRRALDPADVVVARLSGIGWRPVGSRAAAAGRVVLERVVLGTATQSGVLEPYASDPFVITDTTLPEVRRLDTQLEGALGWRLGPWSVGLSGAVFIEDHRTRNARFPRLGKATTPAASLGVARALPWARVRLALMGRWIGGNETLILPAPAAPGRVYLLDGYSEPDAREVQPQTGLFRRTERDALAYGAAASGTLLGTSWVVFAENTRRTDDHVSARQEDPPTDRWHATGSAYGLAVQWPLSHYDLYLTAQWRLNRLRGDASRAGLTGFIFRATESVGHLTADVRYLPASPWAVAATFALVRESRLREDFIAEMRSDLRTWAPGLGIEVARSLGVTAVAAGYAVSWYAPSGGIPNPAAMGPIYQQLVAPEQSLYATTARSTAAALTLRHTFPSGTAALLRVRRESLGASGEALPSDALPFAPEGSRTLWNVSLGVVLGQRQGS